jgi:hypothetical protein
VEKIARQTLFKACWTSMAKENKILGYDKDEGSNLNVMTNALKSIISL